MQRNVAVVVILSIVTFGIYSLYWLYDTWRSTAESNGRQHSAKLVFGFALACWIVMLLALAAYMFASFATALNDIANGGQGDPPVRTLVLLLVSTVVMIIAGLAGTVLMLIMVYHATENTRIALERHGLQQALPPVAHVLLALFINVWIYVVVGLGQHELNKLHT